MDCDDDSAQDFLLSPVVMFPLKLCLALVRPTKVLFAAKLMTSLSQPKLM
jgi:hypothetical protein